MGRPDCEVTGVPYEQLHVLGSQIRSCGYWAGHVLRSDAGSMLLRMAVRKDSMSSLAGTGRLVPTPLRHRAEGLVGRGPRSTGRLRSAALPRPTWLPWSKGSPCNAHTLQI